MGITPQIHSAHPGETTLIEIRPSVAVVGAGVAGVTVGRLLAGRGYPVTIFDKGPAVGGRLTARREGEYVFDHGCQFVTVRDERFRRYVESWVEQGLLSRWKLRLASCERGQSITLHDDTLRYVGVPDMGATVRQMADGLDVKPGTTVSGFVREDNEWRIKADPAPPDETYEIVIVTAPAEQAVPLLAASPELQAAAATVRMQPCWAVMVVLDFELDLPFDAAFVRGSPLAWVANNGSKPGRAAHECWVLHASPSWSREHVEASPDQVVETLLPAFFDAVGVKAVKPVVTFAHRWRFASPENALDVGYLWDPENGVGACGDWCLSARAENAFLSGLELAERIMSEKPRARL